MKNKLKNREKDERMERVGEAFVYLSNHKLITCDTARIYTIDISCLCVCTYVYVCVSCVFISMCNFGNTQITGLVAVPLLESEEFAWILSRRVCVCVRQLLQTDLIFTLYHRIILIVQACLLQLTHIKAQSCSENAVTSSVTSDGEQTVWMRRSAE